MNVYTGKPAGEEGHCASPKDWKEWGAFAWCRSLDWIDAERVIAVFTVIEAPILEAVRTGNLRLFVWGWAAYRDIFPDTPERETQFCFELNRVDGAPYEMPLDEATKPTIYFNFSSRGRHNCADEDCNQAQ